jgi:hypothetical protein
MSERSKVLAGIGVWFLVMLAAGGAGAFVSAPQQPPVALGLCFAVPVAVFALLYHYVPSVRRVAQSADLGVLTLLHLWRLGGADFLLEYSQGRLPAGFAFPAGIGDVIIGLTAIPMALALRRDPERGRPWFIIWNIFGLVDLVLAVGSGILHSESSLGLLAGSGPTTQIMTVLPRSMIPTFFVPLFISLHLLAINRMRKLRTGDFFTMRGSSMRLAREARATRDRRKDNEI